MRTNYKKEKTSCSIPSLDSFLPLLPVCVKNRERIGANDVGQMIKELNHTRRERRREIGDEKDRQRERNKTHLLWL